MNDAEVLKDVLSKAIIDKLTERSFALKMANALNISVHTVYNIRDKNVNNIDTLLKASEYLKKQVELNVKS